MNVPVLPFAETRLEFVLSRAPPRARSSFVCLAVFSIFAWYMMIFKGLQMRRAKKLNQYFDSEFRAQKSVLGIFDRRLEVNGCPFFAVYQEAAWNWTPASKARPAARASPTSASKAWSTSSARSKARCPGVAQTGIGFDSSGHAVSGAPFLGLLGTVWE